MKLLQKFYKWLRPDGVLHLSISALLVLLLSISALLVLLLLPLAPACRWWIAAGVVVILGLAKEFYDSTDPAHSAEWHDVACDLIGIALGVGLFFCCLGLHNLLWP